MKGRPIPEVRNLVKCNRFMPKPNIAHFPDLPPFLKYSSTNAFITSQGFAHVAIQLAAACDHLSHPSPASHRKICHLLVRSSPSPFWKSVGNPEIYNMENVLWVLQGTLFHLDLAEFAKVGPIAESLLIWAALLGIMTWRRWCPRGCPHGSGVGFDSG